MNIDGPNSNFAEREDERRRELFDRNLYWLLNESAAELEFSAISIEPSYGGSSDDPGISEGQRAAGGKCRRLIGALDSLDRRDKAILIAAHTPILPWNRPLAAKLERPVDRFGCSIASVVFLLSGKEMIENALDLTCLPRRMREALPSLALENAINTITKSRREASAALSKALKNFWSELAIARRAAIEIARLKERRSIETPVSVRSVERVGKAGLWPAARKEPDWARKSTRAA